MYGEHEVLVDINTFAAERKRRLSIKKAASNIKKLREKSGKRDGVAEIRSVLGHKGKNWSH
jgi:hypothetical protein